jgi:hypothetical protein
MKQKLLIIDEITKRHPSYGIKKGWSTYTGGMKDSGHWFVRKMLEEPIEDLKFFLDGIIREENRPSVHTVEPTTEYSMKLFLIENERKLFFGDET